MSDSVCKYVLTPSQLRFNQHDEGSLIVKPLNDYTECIYKISTDGSY